MKIILVDKNNNVLLDNPLFDNKFKLLSNKLKSLDKSIILEAIKEIKKIIKNNEDDEILLNNFITIDFNIPETIKKLLESLKDINDEELTNLKYQLCKTIKYIAVFSCKLCDYTYSLEMVPLLEHIVKNSENRDIIAICISTTINMAFIGDTYEHFKLAISNSSIVDVSNSIVEQWNNQFCSINYISDYKILYSIFLLYNRLLSENTDKNEIFLKTFQMTHKLFKIINKHSNYNTKEEKENHEIILLLFIQTCLKGYFINGRELINDEFFQDVLELTYHSNEPIKNASFVAIEHFMWDYKYFKFIIHKSFLSNLKRNLSIIFTITNEKELEGYRNQLTLLNTVSMILKQTFLENNNNGVLNLQLLMDLDIPKLLVQILNKDEINSTSIIQNSGFSQIKNNTIILIYSIIRYYQNEERLSILLNFIQLNLIKNLSKTLKEFSDNIIQIRTIKIQNKKIVLEVYDVIIKIIDMTMGYNENFQSIDLLEEYGVFEILNSLKNLNHFKGYFIRKILEKYNNNKNNK